MSLTIEKIRDALVNYLDAQPRPKQRLPEVLQFPINDICNSRCQMCNIWQQKRDVEITPEQVRKALSNPLFREVKTVGINGGEPTLRRDIGELVEAVIEALPKLKGISLITNAILHKKVIAAIEDIGAICRRNGIHLDVMVSLDGVGEVHDRVRGRPGNFDSAVEVLDHLASSPNVGSFRVGCTVIRENVYGVEDLLEWCRARGIYARFRLGVPHKRLYSDQVTEPFGLTEDEKYHFGTFLDHLYHRYEKNETRRAFYRSLRDQLVYDKPRTAGCAWKNKGATLSPRGELMYCAVESNVLGDVLEDDAEKLYWSNSSHLEEIVSSRCAGCHHDYEGLSDRGIYLKQVLRKRLDRLPEPARNAIRYLNRSYGRHKEKSRISRAMAGLSQR